MTMNVSMNSSYYFENRDSLQNTAKEILSSKGADNNNAQKIVNKVFQENESIYGAPQLAVLKASAQITLNNSLNETLKYLKTHAKSKSKQNKKFGDLWQIFSVNNEASEENPYRGELLHFEIDKNAKNIFAA